VIDLGWQPSKNKLAAGSGQHLEDDGPAGSVLISALCSRLLPAATCLLPPACFRLRCLHTLQMPFSVHVPFFTPHSIPFCCMTSILGVLLIYTIRRFRVQCGYPQYVVAVRIA